jgi:hypothetical protein
MKPKQIELWKHEHSKEKCKYCTRYQFHSCMVSNTVRNRHYCYSIETNMYKILSEKDIQHKCENFNPIMMNTKKKKIYHMSN